MDHVLLASRVLIGVVFAVSFLTKTLRKNGWSEFLDSVRDLAPVLPVRTTALAASAAEVVVIALLVPTGSARYGFVGAVLLLLPYTTALILAVRRGTSAPCGCFGRSSTPVSGFHVARNALLTAVALTGALAGQEAARAHPAWPGAVTALAAGLVAAVLVIFTDELSDVFSVKP
ncbi:MauE/DoxX family redox-associated membrane protein [Streptomyces sp. NPDC058953]|uniref:MauE/DoxX family redox-associated membrane protein n=1 Tax=unclassified Streptomyces TaxID=2593676 RepID=UPI00367DF010